MDLAKVIQKGGVGVLPTDTIYGLVGSALNKAAVERIYQIRRRAPQKPMIILISSINELANFMGQPERLKAEVFLKKIWPNPVSIILPVPHRRWNYLHRGTKTLAFRMPKPVKLLNLLKKTGPLVVPSANFEGEKPAMTIEEAKEYFGDKVDFYEEGGKLDAKPSTLIEIKNNKIIILRQGGYELKIGKL